MGRVVDLYRARVASGALSPDTAQAAAADRLDALADAMAAWKPKRLFGSSPAPRGIYLWGPVGRANRC